MGRFFDRNELVIIVTIILIFDLNAGVREFIEYIFYSGKSGFVPFILVLMSILLDTYVLHVVATTGYYEDVTYVPVTPYQIQVQIQVQV